jgi:Fatty-acid desaturase
MSQTAQQQMVSQAPMVAVTPIGVPNQIGRRRHTTWTVILFCAITMSAVIGVPLFGYFYHYTWLDWSLFGLLYVASGLGITVGYHRLIVPSEL